MQKLINCFSTVMDKVTIFIMKVEKEDKIKTNKINESYKMIKTIFFKNQIRCFLAVYKCSVHN